MLSSAESPDAALALSGSDRRLRRLAWALFVVTVAASVASIPLDVAAGRSSNNIGALPFLSYMVIGLLLAVRRPHNPLGWLMLFAAFGFAAPGESYAHYVVSGHDQLPGAALAMAISAPTWVPFIGLSGFMLPLFPDGHLPSPRWRWFARVCAGGLVALFLLILVAPGNFGDEYGLPQLDNPLGIAALKPLMTSLLALVLFAPLIVVGGAVGVIARVRRTIDVVERQQLRWLAWGAAVIAVAYVIAFIPGLLGSTSGQWSDWLGTLAVCTFMLIPVTICIAVLKYRLFDIDVVIRKTVLYVVLAVLILAVGFGMAWILSRLFASTIGGGRRLELITGIAVGLLFWPLRRVATRISDRVVYGGRATPYEVLAEFGERLAGTYAADDVLERTAKVLAEGVGADRARVWLLVDDGLKPVATWSRAEVDVPRPDDHRADVRHQGEFLGALSVSMPANDPMDPAKEKLLSDLAAQAGLLLRNVGLVEDLRASRRRLVTAQDSERRRLERNIHDGAQQQLVALAVQLKLADGMVDRDPAKAHELLTRLQGQTHSTLEDLRDLARGSYPPLLADKGLAAALEAQARKSAVPIEVRAADVARYPQELEAAVYFSCLEAMQNDAKYAEAVRATVTLASVDDALTFTVSDDGRGFDPMAVESGTGLQGMADRVNALDGTLEVRSAPGRGTTVVGRIPAEPADVPLRVGG